jgi:hypothetical protein
MIVCQAEILEDALDELRPLLEVHYRELAMHQDKVPLAPQFDIYIAHERAGQLIFQTIRDDGELVGYFVGFVSPGLHYSETLTCRMDIFFIAPRCRGEGMAGLKLFRGVEKELRNRGVQHWFVGCKIAADVAPLFRRLGFAPIETYYSKWIGE